MNRSILKTRNQLQRITYKINQLKTKYTGDQYKPLMDNLQNSPSMKYKDKQYNQLWKDKVNKGSGNKVCGGSCEEVWQRQIKIFRTEIYNYIDKYLLINKQKQQELIKDLIQKYNENILNTSNTTLEQRILKIQEETTDCISSAQDTLLQLQNRESHVDQQIQQLQRQFKKDIKIIGENIKINKQENLKNYDELVIRVLSAQQQFMSAKDLFGKDPTHENTDPLIQKIWQKIQHLENTLSTKLPQPNNQITDQLTNSNYKNLKKQIQRHQSLTNQIEKRLEQLKIKQREQVFKQTIIIDKIKLLISAQIKQLVQSGKGNFQMKNCQLTTLIQLIKQLENKVQNVSNLLNYTKLAISPQHKKIPSQFSPHTSSMRSLHEQLPLSPKPSTIKPSKQAKIQQNMLFNIYLKQNIQQLRLQLNTKLIHQLNQIKKQLLSDIDIDTKIKKCITQRYQKGQKNDYGVNITNQQLTELQIKFKNFIHQEIEEQIKSKKFGKKFSTPEKISQYCQAIQNSVDQKLNQFENDINQTIKLLYEDIQNKVNDMLKNNIKPSKQSSNLLQSNTSIQTKQLHEQNNTHQQNDTSQTELSENNNNSINLSEKKKQNYLAQLEKNVQELSTKSEKLDNNFLYIYERMSNIQYDNANFKDMLTSLLTKTPNIDQPKSQRFLPQPQTKQKSNTILEVFGQLNPGQTFFENL